MEKNIYDFLKTVDVNNILLIEDSDIKSKSLLKDNLNTDNTTIISIDKENIINQFKTSIYSKKFDVIINDTEYYSKSFLDTVYLAYQEFPLIIIKSGSIAEVYGYALLSSPLSNNYQILYTFNNLNSKLNDENPLNNEVNDYLNQMYLSEYENNNSFSRKVSSKFYPLSLLINSNKIGGIRNIPVNIKGYKKLSNSDFMDVGYYLRRNHIENCDNVYLHYLYEGSEKGYQPNDNFSNENYLIANPDLKNIQINPTLHYLLYGQDENRIINKKIRGDLQTNFKNDILRGWIAEIGTLKTLNAEILIDEDKYVIPANLYREDLENKKINYGEHGFEFNIPDKYKDEKTHKIRLYGPGNVKLAEIDYKRQKIVKKPKITIRGAFQSSIKDTLIRGWVAEIGNNNPIQAIIKIDEKSYPIIADIYRDDLKKNKINEGKHGFEFNIPNEFIDGKPHKIQLIVKDKIISEISHSFNNYDYENNIERFFANSMVSPEMILPPNEPRKKILAVMSNIAEYLRNQVTENPLVSVIMPVYNREELVSTAIYSVLNQSYENIELIIVNDCSTDNTLETIKEIEDSRIKLINNEVNQGISKSRNIALKESKGKYIMYLDSDNDWEKDYVKTMVGAFCVLEDADSIYSGQYVYEKNRNNLKYIRYGTINRGLLANRNYIDLNCFCHTRKVYEDYGGFDESLERFVDWDLILKYVTFGKIYSIPVILSNYYNHIAENSVSNDVELLNQSEEVIKKHEERLKSKKYSFEMKHGVSVIIPSYQSLNDLKDCLNSLFNLNAPWLEVIVVDNNSDEDVLKYLISLKNENKIKLILNKENMGFTYATKQGIAISEISNDILLLNNDAIVTENAIQLLQNAAYELKDCGMTVPQQILPANTKTMNIHIPFAQKDVECDVNLSNHHKNIINVPLFHDGEYTELSFAPFFCVYIKRDTYNMSIGLDEELGRHFRSDMIYCNYIRTVLNKKIYHVSEARVYHKLQQATTTLRKKSMKEHNLLYVQNRWSKEEQKKYGYKRAKWDVD